MQEKKKLKADNFDQDLEAQLMSPTYTGEVRVGWENQTLMRVLFDTGSDWLAIPSSECDNCGTRTTRDNTISATKVVEKYSPEQLVYGSASLNGGVW